MSSGNKSASMTDSILDESHSASPSTRPSTCPRRSIKKVVGQTVDFEGLRKRAFGIEIGLDRFEPQLGDERRHRLAAADILRDREHRNLVAETGLQAFERRHLTSARRAPSRPKVQQNRPAGEIG